MAYFHFNDWQMIGSSPEVMVKAEREPTAWWHRYARLLGHVHAVRHPGRCIEDLLLDPKEIAEHVMLVDLGRNDLVVSASSARSELMN